jgi:hypothetical protein
MTNSVLVAARCDVECVFDIFDFTVGIDALVNAVIDTVASVEDPAVVTAFAATNPAVVVAPAIGRSAPVIGVGVGGGFRVGSTLGGTGLAVGFGACNRVWVADVALIILAQAGSVSKRARAAGTDARVRPIATDRS